MRKIPFVVDYNIYNLSEIKKFIADSVNSSMTVANNKGIHFYNVASCFDIETTSFYIDEFGEVIDFDTKLQRKQKDENYNPTKYATMYFWQFGLNGRVIMGRTWDEFFSFLDVLCDTLNLSIENRLICYVHNLSFEFQFIRKWLEWEKVFSIEERKPIYALAKCGIEFRCSYLLSGYSLANLSRDLMRYKVEKMVGDLDYSLLRNCKTPLTEKEIKYCVNDVFVVMAYIQEKIEQESTHSIVSLPLTKTGYVRNYCRNHTLYLASNHKLNKKYKTLMQDLTIADNTEFETMQRAFAGGFTHCNAIYSGEVCEDVTSYDFTSSYPYVMLSEKYPMSRGFKVQIESKEQFYNLVNNKRFLAIFDIRFTNIFTTANYENYISASKCFEKVNAVENNGRVVCADVISTTITSVDFAVIEQFYKWDYMQVNYMYVYHAQYLPTEFVKCILTFYEKKTTLKGVAGSEIEYMLSKNMLNACYGMAVTSPLRPDYYYELDEWGVRQLENPDEAIAENNEKFSRFLFYAWGVFVTAYARRNLFTGIFECKNDYIYADTDSIKIFNADAHKQYFDAYNSLCYDKLKRASEFHKIPFSKFAPQTKEGKTKMLGVWDFDGHYDYFKSLGAKRYMVSKEHALGEYPISITVSGINKNSAVPYIMRESKGDIVKAFNMFSEGMHIPEKETGKNIHTYIDDEQRGVLTDYLGNSADFYEKSSVHLEPTSYDLSIASMYAKYLKNIKTNNV